MLLKKCSELQIGMVIAKDVRSRTGDILITAGTEIDISTIIELSEHGISFVFVKEDGKEKGSESSAKKEVAGKVDAAAASAKVKREKIIPFSDEKESYYEKINQSQDFKEFRGKFSSGVVKLRGLLNRVLQGTLETDLVTAGKKIVDELKMPEGTIPTFDLISNLRRFEDVIYVHSLNVAVLSGMLAEWLELPKEDVEMVKICGLYHCVGKLTIPVEIISKPSKITKEEYDIIKNYPRAGYDILKKNGANERILNVAYQHNQNCDGSGYPSGFDPKKLDFFSKIINIVAIYDAITSVRAYRGMVCPFKVIRMFEEEGMAKYDARVFRVFLENMANNFIGNQVKLSDGRVARILMTNKTYFSMPMVISDGEYIDLAKRRDLYIDEVI